MQTIYLIGFMGCGKSTIGKQLSLRLSKQHVDTDSYIEEKYKQSISDIFQKQGEKTFRTYETESLKEIDIKGIISTGGGIVEKEENINIMMDKGIIVYLETPFKEIVSRLETDKNRPLWNKDHEEQMEKLYTKRKALYRRNANITIETKDKTIEEIVLEIEKQINSNG